ncbi:MAG: hypothetical protein ACLPX5_10965 [Dissulfurispiraceae bacterium]
MKALYDEGAIGENNNGSFIETRDTAVLHLKQKADVTRFAAQGNQVRKSLYSEIVKANRYGFEVVAQVRKIVSIVGEESPSLAGEFKMIVVCGKEEIAEVSCYV